MPSKPIHPATVHFPFAFLALAFGLDILTTLAPNLPRAITSNLPPSTDLTRAAYYLLSLGLVTAIPAVVTGGAEAFKMISKQGMYEADRVTVKNKVKATIAHAVANDLVLAAATYVWYARRARAAATLAGHLGVGTLSTAAAAYTPEAWMVGVEAVIAVLLVIAANIGGTLTYNFGIGFQAMSSGGKKAQ